MFQDLAKRSRRERGGLHCHIRLATIEVAKHFVPACLTYLDETRANKTYNGYVRAVRGGL